MTQNDQKKQITPHEIEISGFNFCTFTASNKAMYTNSHNNFNKENVRKKFLCPSGQACTPS